MLVSQTKEIIKILLLRVHQHGRAMTSVEKGNSSFSVYLMLKNFIPVELTFHHYSYKCFSRSFHSIAGNTFVHATVLPPDGVEHTSVALSNLAVVLEFNPRNLGLWVTARFTSHCHLVRLPRRDHVFWFLCYPWWIYKRILTKFLI